MSLASFPTELIRYCLSFLDAFNLANCSSVNKEWYSIIEENGKDLWHFLSLGCFPILLITNSNETGSVTSTPTPISAKSPFSTNWNGFSKQEKEFGNDWPTKQWKLFAKQVALFYRQYKEVMDKSSFHERVVEERHKIRDKIVKDIMIWGIDASTTDKPNQSVHNAITSSRGGFWSSEPNPKEDSVDWLLYLIRKSSFPRALLITSITIKSMIAYWQENRIYAPKKVQIHLYLNGHHPDSEVSKQMKRQKKAYQEPQPMYSSPEFDYDINSGAHQVFPVGPIMILTQHPNDRIYIKIDFIGKIAKHYDDFYYTCIDKVFAHGYRFCYDQSDTLLEPMERKLQHEATLKEAQEAIGGNKNNKESLPRLTSKDTTGLKWFNYNGMSDRQVHWNDGVIDEEEDDVFDEYIESDDEMAEEDGDDTGNENQDTTARRPAFRNQASSMLNAYLRLLGVRMRLIPQQSTEDDEDEEQDAMGEEEDDEEYEEVEDEDEEDIDAHNSENHELDSLE